MLTATIVAGVAGIEQIKALEQINKCPYCRRSYRFQKPEHGSCDGCGAPVMRNVGAPVMRNVGAGIPYDRQNIPYIVQPENVCRILF